VDFSSILKCKGREVGWSFLCLKHSPLILKN
jgi:hypothetical protein